MHNLTLSSFQFPCKVLRCKIVYVGLKSKSIALKEASETNTMGSNLILLNCVLDLTAYIAFSDITRILIHPTCQFRPLNQLLVKLEDLLFQKQYFGVSVFCRNCWLIERICRGRERRVS